MARLGLSALKSLLRGKGLGRTSASRWQPPQASWSRPLGLGWQAPYTVRYASNLDDGPNHGMPLGGFGAGCIGRAPDGNVNLSHLDGGAHRFGVLPDSQFALFESNSETSRFIELIREVTVGKTLLTVEHDMGVVFGLADKIAVLVYGEVLAFDTPDEVRANARVQEAYLGSPEEQAAGH